MYFSLLALGVVLTAAGLVTIGFGIPINAFSLGNTLIIAGTTAAVAGILVIGIAALFRELQRIALALDLRPTGRQTRPAGAETAFIPPMMSEPMRAPAQPRPTEPEMPRPAEPRVPVASAPEASRPLDWLRNRPRNGRSDDQPAEISDEEPQSPRPSARPSLSPLATMAEPVLDSKPWPPKRAELGEARTDQIARAPSAEGAAEETKQSRLFDKLWPSSRQARPIPAGPDQDAAAVEETQPSSTEQPQDEAPAADQHSEVTTGNAAPRQVAILKAGVIDGMAYTLYVDGSIEAELPQGTLRFASVEELRAHLDQNS
jgi:hypothetical protein